MEWRQDCGLISMKIPCYAIYILHRIGTTNLTLASDLAKTYLNDWSKNPFLKKKTDLILTGTLIPGQKATLQIQFLKIEPCFA